MTDTATASGSTEAPVTRRALLVRDSLTFLTLGFAAIALYAVTFLLFRSFEAHREELAKRWSERGRAALSTGHPAQAITSLRAALSYAPDEPDYQLLLAQALASAGHTDEATNYFLNLWEAKPGDGFINLQLARLARNRRETQQATDYYRAAIYGGWQTNGLDARRVVRLELADYLVSLHELLAARAELLISAGNTPDSPSSDRLLGDKLAGAGDLPDALTLYNRAVADDPHSRLSLERAGSTAFALGDYQQAAHLLRRALDAKPEPGVRLSTGDMEKLAHDASRLLDLSLSRDLPANVRAQHLLVASHIAESRLSACVAHLTPTSPTALEAPLRQPGSLQPPAPAVPVAAQSGPLLDLRARWKAATTAPAQRAMMTDGATQDNLTELIADTEQQAATSCGTPVGDDALLLRVAQSAATADRQQ